MRLIQKGMGAGKTHDLLKMYTPEQIILCFCKQECDRVKVLGKKMGKEVTAMTMDELKKGQQGRHGSKDILIDNVDMVLQRFFYPDVVEVVTLSGYQEHR